jgi:SPOR domain
VTDSGRNVNAPRLFQAWLYDKSVALAPESAREKAALLHSRWLRVFVLVLILLGGFFAILYLGQPHAATVKASDTGPKVEPLTTQPAPVPPKEPFRTALPHPAAGLTYLQLSATRRKSAEHMIDDLRKKNFEAVTSEIDGKPGLFRVLVGPVSNTGVVQLRADLERAGFPGNAAVRRTSAESNPPKPGNTITSSARTTKEGTTNRPAAGQIYLELSVTSRESAQLSVDALRQKKLNAMASEIIEKPGMFRVLVGPVEGAGIAQMRADLEGAGFSGSVAIRIPAESDPANPDAVKSLSAEATKADASNRPVAERAYLEFSATSPQTAEIIADALHQKGFEATASETEDPPGGFRVLVKPPNDTSIDQLRADLERAGFHGDAAMLRVSK